MFEQFVEETWLLQLIVVVLMLHVADDNLLVNADGGREVASCPERLFFIQAVGTFDLLLEPSGRLPLQYLHNVKRHQQPHRAASQTSLAFGTPCRPRATTFEAQHDRDRFIAARPATSAQNPKLTPHRRREFEKNGQSVDGLRLGGAGRQPRHDSSVTIAATGELMLLSCLRRKGGSLLFGLSPLPG
jgi:hypothetical protein